MFSIADKDSTRNKSTDEIQNTDRYTDVRQPTTALLPLVCLTVLYHDAVAAAYHRIVGLY